MDTAFNIPIGDNGYTDKDSMPAHIEFFTEMQLMSYESEQQGRRVEKPVTMIQFIFPGGKTIFPRAATDHDKIIYRKQWEQFQANQSQIGDGLPIELWSAIDNSQKMNLKAMHIHTVDQLASASDNDLSKIGMGSLDLRMRARAYVEANKSGAKTEELRAENRVLATQVEELKNQVNSMLEMLRSGPVVSLQEQNKEAFKKRGRPKKVIEGSGDDDT